MILTTVFRLVCHFSCSLYTNNDIHCGYCLVPYTAVYVWSLSGQVMKEEKCNMAMLLQYMLHDMLARFEGGKMEPIYLDYGFSGGEILQYDLFKVNLNWACHFLIL